MLAPGTDVHTQIESTDDYAAHNQSKLCKQDMCNDLIDQLLAMQYRCTQFCEHYMQQSIYSLLSLRPFWLSNSWDNTLTRDA